MHEVELCVSEGVQQVPQLVRINPGEKLQEAIRYNDTSFARNGCTMQLSNICNLKKAFHLKSK